MHSNGILKYAWRELSVDGQHNPLSGCPFMSCGNPYVRNGMETVCSITWWFPRSLRGHLRPVPWGGCCSLPWNLRFCMHFIFIFIKNSQFSLVPLESDPLHLLINLVYFCFFQNTFITIIAATTLTEKIFPSSFPPNTVAWYLRLLKPNVLVFVIYWKKTWMYNNLKIV